MLGNEDNKSLESPAAVNRVSVKVPPFWKDNATIWFKQIESQFINAGINSDTTKYHTVVGNIETEVLSQVSDIIVSPPTSHAYDALKKRLIEVFSESEERKLKKLLQDIDLGDKRPSVLLRQMKDLAGERIASQLLQSLWLQRLPSQMQAILAASEDDLPKLAIMADKIADVTLPEIHSSELKMKMNDSDLRSSNTFEDLQKQILDLSQKVDRLFTLHSRGRSPFRSNSRNSSRHRSPPCDICWYHLKFREKATKCNAPCSFKSEN